MRIQAEHNVKARELKYFVQMKKRSTPSDFSLTKDTHTHTHTHIGTHAHTHRCTHVRRHARSDARTHTHTHTHTHKHTHPHTSTHTYRLRHIGLDTFTHINVEIILYTEWTG